MKKTLLVLIVLMAAVAVAQAQVIQMKLGHFAAESHPGNLAARCSPRRWRNARTGRSKIAIYPNNALGSPPEVLEQNILGAVDMSLPTQGQLGKYSKKFNCVMLPFAFDELRACRQGTRWKVHPLGGPGPGPGRPGIPLQLGVGLPQPDERQTAR